MLHQLAIFALLAARLASAQTTTATAPGPGASCSGAVAYCAGGPIILRCDGTELYPGNCDDNLNEPPLGALCVDPATSTGTGGAAFCSAYTPTTTASSTVAVTTSVSSTPFTNPTLGASCTGTAAVCAASPGQGPIIIRCEDSKVVAGNCDDNLGEPANGAVCIGNSPSAYCSAYPTVSSTTTTTASATSTPFTTPTLGASCTGTAASCAATPGQGPIIIRCEDSKVVAGNCDDNLGEPANGAVCVGEAPSAYCSAYPTTSLVGSSVASATSIPASVTPYTSSSVVTTSAISTSTALGPGSPCTGDTAYCAGGPIILRCESSTIVAGNCDDNLGEPLYGATCTGTPGMASCSALSSPTAVLSSSSVLSSSVSAASSPSVTSASTEASTTPAAIGITAAGTASVTPYTGSATRSVLGMRGSLDWMVYTGGVLATMILGAAMLVL